MRYKFKLLVGLHTDTAVTPEGKETEVTYGTGSEFVTKTDLRKQNGTGGMTQKFQFLGEVEDAKK